jgi:hypothetical protein
MRRRYGIDSDAPKVLTFTAQEFSVLHFNRPAASPLGGYPRHENWIIRNSDRKTLQCVMDLERFERTIRYCREYGSGGPQGRLRKACIPALARIGIDVFSER